MTSGGLVQQHRSSFSFLARGIDALVIGLSLVLSAEAYGIELDDSYALTGVLAIVFFGFAAELAQLYQVFRGSHFAEETRDVFASWVVAVVATLAFAFLTKRSAVYSRVVFTAWFVVAPFAVTLWRAVARVALRRARAAGRNTKTVAVAGAGVLGTRIARYVHENPWLGMRIVGLYDDLKPPQSNPVEGVPMPILGTLDDLAARAVAGGIDIVYLALPFRAEERMREVLEKLRDSTVSAFVVPDVWAFDLLYSRVVTLGTIPTISVFDDPFQGVDGVLKRLEDIVLSTLILTVISVPMAVIGVAVRLSSPGPALFKQWCYGLDGRAIEVWKFRSMTVMEDGPTVPQARREDPRVTKLGAFLRRTSLDELPQFINVLQGHMSVVGPRPHAVAHNEQFRGQIRGYMLRHKVKPGITGWAQVNGWRGETDTLEKMEKRIEHDLWYIRNWSVFLDVRIVAMTILRGFVGRNTY